MDCGESNVTCPMTSRDAKWSRLSHINIISILCICYQFTEQRLHYNIAFNKALRTYSVLQPPCNTTEILKNEMSRVCI